MRRASCQEIYDENALDGQSALMSRMAALAIAVVMLSSLVGYHSVRAVPTPSEVEFPPRLFTNGAVSIDLSYPFNYASIPAGAEIALNVSGNGFTVVRYSLDGEPPQTLGPPYTMDTSAWPAGTHVLEVEAANGGSVVASKVFVFFIDPEATWPPDTVPVDLILVGFQIPPQDLVDRLWSTYDILRTLGGISEAFNLTFEFEAHAANASYHANLLRYLQMKAVYRDDLQARLNLTALVDQRDNGTLRDIFDSLKGWEIETSWVELYLKEFPPIPSLEPTGYTFYLLNLSALDDPLQAIDHWFVEETLDPDALRPQDWWRLEWDNDLNTPMGYPLNTWGGPGHIVYVDPTAYQWYLDWTYIWWSGGTERAPYGFQWEEVSAGLRLDYIAGVVNDLIQGLGASLPGTPPTDSRLLLKNYVLSGSADYTLDELSWVSSDLALQTYLEAVLPFKTWTVNTTYSPIDGYPNLKAAVDANTTFSGGQGAIDGLAIWNYLFDQKDQFVTDETDVFEVLTVNLLYDNRSMIYSGREFTGLGGSGITAIFMKTDRLFYADGTRQKGLTSIISHETGHNLGYGHQFGPNYRSDFVKGNMGYFLNDLRYGLFWEDALHRLYIREKLQDVLTLLDSREPLDLAPEFPSFYARYRDLDFLGAHAVLVGIEQMLSDPVPPVAEAGAEVIVEEDRPVTLDGGASSDNFRILKYTWDFGEGPQVTMPGPTVTKTWSDPGTYTVTLTVFDARGNSASDALLATVLDTTPPTVSIASPPRGSTLTTEVVTIAWEVADNGPAILRIEVSLDEGAPIFLPGDATEHTFSSLKDGHHVVTVRAIDQADNWDVASVSFVVEAAADVPAGPTVTIVSPAQGAILLSRDVRVRWAVEGDVTSIQHIELGLDGGTPVLLAGDATEYTFSDLEDGHHVATVTVYDEADISNDDVVSFKVDTGPPQPTGQLEVWYLVGLAVSGATIFGLLGLILYMRHQNRSPPGKKA